MPLSVFSPMLATTGQPAGDPGDWAWEVKWDGWRALVYVDGALRVRTRTRREVSESLPELLGLVDALNGHTAIIDGELVVCRDGAIDFYALAPRMMRSGRTAQWAANVTPVTFVAFDFWRLDGEDLIYRPLAARKALLDELQLVGPAWATNGWHPGDGATMFEVCSQLGHEGVVAKRLDAPYVPGRRSRTWLKQKCPGWLVDHAPRRRPGG